MLFAALVVLSDPCLPLRLFFPLQVLAFIVETEALEHKFLVILRPSCFDSISDTCVQVEFFSSHALSLMMDTTLQLGTPKNNERIFSPVFES